MIISFKIIFVGMESIAKSSRYKVSVPDMKDYKHAVTKEDVDLFTR